MANDQTHEDLMEDIIEDLSYSMASPEADHLFNLIMSKKWAGARKILKEYIDTSEEIDDLIKYIFNKDNKNVTFVEINKKSIKAPELTDYYTVEVGKYLIRYRSHVQSATIYALKEREDDNVILFVYINSQRVLVKDLDQIWNISKV